MKEPKDIADIETRSARSGRDRGKRLEVIEDRLTKLGGSTHMASDRSGVMKFYGKVGDIETVLLENVNDAAAWVRWQLHQSRDVAWIKALCITYPKSGKKRQRSGWDSRSDYDRDNDGGASASLLVEVYMIGFLPAIGWRKIPFDDFAEATDRLKESDLIHDSLEWEGLPHRTDPEDYGDTVTVWMEYDEGLHRSLKSIEQIIVNARRSIYKLLGNDAAVQRLSKLGEADIPLLLTAST